MRRRRADGLSVLFGLTFLALAGGWLLAQLFDVPRTALVLGWALAGLLIAYGVRGVVRAERAQRRGWKR
jgi:hypothetical protein